MARTNRWLSAVCNQRLWSQMETAGESGDTRWNFGVRVRLQLGMDVDKLMFAFGNVAWSGTVGLTTAVVGDQGTLHFTKFSVELEDQAVPGYGAAYAPVTFSGIRTFDVPRLTVKQLSDELDVATAFPGLTYIPKSTWMWIRIAFYILNPTNNFNFPTSIRTDDFLGATGNSFYAQDEGTGVTLTSNIDGTGQLQWTDGQHNTAANALVPMVLGQCPDGDPVVPMWLAGPNCQNGDLSSYVDKSCLNEALTEAIRPCIILNSGNTQATCPWYDDTSIFSGSGANSQWFDEYAEYADVFILELLGEYRTAGITTAHKITSMRNLCTRAKNAGMTVVIQNLSPRSGGSWTTDPDANQTLNDLDQIAAQDMQTAVDQALADGICDFVLTLTGIHHQLTGIGRHRWSVIPYNGVFPPFTSDGDRPISANVHNLIMAKAVRDFMSLMDSVYDGGTGTAVEILGSKSHNTTSVGHVFGRDLSAPLLTRYKR